MKDTLEARERLLFILESMKEVARICSIPGWWYK